MTLSTDVISLGGYPVTITGLSANDVLFFNGQFWTNIPETDAQPIVFDLDEPTYHSERQAYFSGLPIILTNLQPGDVLTIATLRYSTPIEAIVSADAFFEVIANAPWGAVRTEVNQTGKPFYTTGIIDAPSAGMTAPAQSARYEYTIA